MTNPTKQSLNKTKPIDLVDLFYKEKIDFKELLKSRSNSSKKVQEFSLEPLDQELTYNQKSHLLRRSLVGTCKRHYEDLDGLSFDEIYDLIFTNESLEEPVNNYYYRRSNQEWNELYGRDDVLPGETFVNNASTERNENDEYENGDWVRRETIESHLNNSIYNQKTSIHWKLFLFLHNLVPTDGGQGIDNKGIWNYHKLIFDSCYGSYKDFIFNITLNPAMLIYLNLSLSQKETPDENYAREVQELFTVGKRPFSMFTEDDVREAARVLVGFQVDYDSIFKDGEVSYVPNQWNHDTGDKQFSSFYGNKKIEGRETEEGMLEELREFVDMLFYPTQSKQYISRRLYQFFVNPVVSDEVENNVIIPLSQVFEDKNYNIIETLKVLLKSKHFFDEGNFFSIIKPPLDYVIGACKELNIFNGNIRNYDDEENGTFSIPERLSDLNIRKLYFGKQIQWPVSQMGMRIGYPPNVSGWAPFYQDPVYDLFWINSVTLIGKNRFMESLCQWGLWMEDGYHLTSDKLEYLLTYQNNEDIDQLIQEMTQRLLCVEISEKDKERIFSQSLNGANKMHWTDIVQRYKNGDTNNTWEVKQIFEKIMFGVFSLGEYNLH
tara:strand:- start:3834 stop:5648 length:1815 start_codon:yes stop_codon:yes gene_type:complete